MSGVIVVRKKNQTIPEDYLKKVLAEYNTCAGGAVILDGEINVARAPIGGSIEGTAETQTGPAAAQDIVYYFGTHTLNAPEDELQPYTLLKDEDDDPLIVGFFDGDFSGYAKAGSSHSDAWFLAHELLIPLFEDYYESKGNDIEAVIRDIGKPVFKTQMHKTWQGRGTITFLVANGNTYTFSQNDKSHDFPWGWVSNSFDFEAPAKEETKKSGWWGKGKAMVEKVVDKPVATPTGPKLPPANTLAKPTDTALPNHAVVEKKRCPVTITKERKIKGWYREHCGTVPPNAKEHPEWPVTIGKSMEEIGAIMTVARQPDDLTNAKVQQERKKDVTPHHIPQPSVEITVGETEPLPALNSTQKAGIMEKFPPSVVAQVLDQNSGTILDPSKIQGLESKWPSFTEAVGFKGLEDTYTWTYKDLISLAKLYPEAAAMLIMQYRASVIGMIKAAKDNAPKTVITEPQKKIVASGSRRMM